MTIAPPEAVTVELVLALSTRSESCWQAPMFDCAAVAVACEQRSVVESLVAVTGIPDWVEDCPVWDFCCSIPPVPSST